MNPTPQTLKRQTERLERGRGGQRHARAAQAREEGHQGRVAVQDVHRRPPCPGHDAKQDAVPVFGGSWWENTLQSLVGEHVAVCVFGGKRKDLRDQVERVQPRACLPGCWTGLPPIAGDLSRGLHLEMQEGLASCSWR